VPADVYRESGNPFVEQAIQFSIAAAKAIVTDKEKKDTLDKLLLQGDADVRYPS
jgi:phosphomevalonate kinase